MAYINAEKAAEIRKNLKKSFPKWKFAVRIRHHSSLQVDIMRADIDFGKYDKHGQGYYSVNVYWLASNYEGKALEALKKVAAICNEGNHDNSDIQSDYFDVGWYFNLGVGKYDKPFELMEAALV